MCHQAQFTLSDTTLEKEKGADEGLHGQNWQHWMRKVGFSNPINHVNYSPNVHDLFEIAKHNPLYDQNFLFNLKLGDSYILNYSNFSKLYGRVIGLKLNKNNKLLSQISINYDFFDNKIVTVCVYIFNLAPILDNKISTVVKEKMADHSLRSKSSHFINLIPG